MTKIPVNSPCPCGSGKKYKKCCGNPVTQSGLAFTSWPPGATLYAYTDESGNTGSNLFDEQQPYFWTCSMVCPVDVDGSAKEVHKKCLSLTGGTELHGNELGFKGIEKIARQIEGYLAQHGARFLFTRINKAHVAATKFVDAVMDSGINKAVSNMHYGIRGLRLPLALSLVQVLTESDRRQFWLAYSREEVDGFCEVVERVKKRIALPIYDPRTTELLMDALAWASSNPKALIDGGRSELNAPNVIAFTLVVSMFHHVHEETGAKVGTFIHDEQNQFAKFLKQSYDALRGFAFETTVLSAITDMKRVPTFACDMQIASSHASIGLQFTDVVLWLLKKYVDSDSRDKIVGDSSRLVRSIVRHGLISEFTFEQLVGECRKIFDFGKTPMSPEQEKAGRKLFLEVEARRKQRMLEAIE